MMEVTLLGSGTSMGVPTIACDCAVCKSPDPRNRRLRCSALVESDGFRLLIDCSMDFREQALRYNIRGAEAVLLTHAHADHVGGMDELRIFSMDTGKPIPIYCSAEVLKDMRSRLSYAFAPAQKGGGVPQLDFRLVDGDFEVGPFRVKPIHVKHGILDILGYRINDLVYVTDASRIPAESLDVMRGCKVLILNALRRRPHSTHMSLGESTAIAQEIRARRTWFVHMCHDLEHETTNSGLPPGIELAYDGLRFNL